MNLLQMSFMITQDKKNQPPSLKQKLRLFFSFNVKKLPEGVQIFCFLFISKLLLDFQSKYHFQSDLNYNLKQKRYTQQPPSSTRGRHAVVVPHLQFKNKTEGLGFQYPILQIDISSLYYLRISKEVGIQSESQHNPLV